MHNSTDDNASFRTYFYQQKKTEQNKTENNYTVQFLCGLEQAHKKKQMSKYLLSC